MAPCESLWGDLSLESQPVVCGGFLISCRMDSERWSGEGGPGGGCNRAGADPLGPWWRLAHRADQESHGPGGGPEPQRSAAALCGNGGGQEEPLS